MSAAEQDQRKLSPTPAELESRIKAVTASPEFQIWSGKMSSLLVRPEERSIFNEGRLAQAEEAKMSDLAAGALIAGIAGIAGTLLGVLVSGIQANRLIDQHERLMREERKASEEERRALQRAASPPPGE